MRYLIEILSILAWTVPLVMWEAKRPLGHWDAMGTWPAEWRQDDRYK